MNGGIEIMEKLYLGTGREIITPEVGGHLVGYRPDVYSESVEDDLAATALFLQQGKQRVLMVSLDVSTLNTALSDRLLDAVAERFSFPREAIILHAIHTHSGPNTVGMDGWGGLDESYCESILLPGILGAAEKAMAAPMPVTVGVGVGESHVASNRRELDGRNRIILGQSAWGPIDRRMTVISFRDEAGSCVANIVHYGCHGTAAGCNHEISRDWAGHMCDTLERETGGITAFFNGCIGDTGPRITNGGTTGWKRVEGKLVGDISYARAIGQLAARDAVGIWRGIWDYHPAELRVAVGKVAIPLKPKEAPETAREMLRAYEGKTVNLFGMIRSHLEAVLAAHAAGEPDRESFVVSQPIVALGNLVISGYPYEIFSEIGLRIDQLVKCARVLTISCVNGSEGYFVTQDTYCRGGYEVEMFRYLNLQAYCDNADFELIRQSVENINSVISSYI